MLFYGAPDELALQLETLSFTRSILKIFSKPRKPHKSDENI